MDQLQGAAEARAELDFIVSLRLNTKESPIPPLAQGRHIAKTLAQSRWPDEVLKRPITAEERPVIQARLAYWANSFLERRKRRKKQKRPVH
jgi:hypothetical protein